MSSRLAPSAELALDALAAAYGVAIEYVDACGARRTVASLTKRKVLAAMGVRAYFPDSIAAELARFECAMWDRGLPACVVETCDGLPLHIPIICSADTQEIVWRIALEGGGSLEGRSDFSALPLLERRELNGRCLQRRQLTLHGPLPLGYHELHIGGIDKPCQLIMSPGQCWLPSVREDGRRLWGIAVQLPLLRSENNWGIGDFSDLASFVRDAASRGVDAVAISPLHSGHLDAADTASPYSPSSRLMLNALFIDVTAVAAFADCAPAQGLIASPAFQAQLASCRDSKWVDYGAVRVLKLSVLRLLYAQAVASSSGAPWQSFQRFLAEQPESLTRGCLFQVLREHFQRIHKRYGDWQAWPAEFRQPDSIAVEQFALEHAEEVQFHAWLQWQAALQLQAVEQAAAGMNIGLYRDLAVGADPNGAECWNNQALMMRRLRIGAPPDRFCPAGQNWGVTAFANRALQEEGYRSFVALLRSNMQHAGALRLDHVMALQRLWCVPEGAPASDGAYLQYDLEDLLNILALESQRNACMIVGEDLGTVPAGLRERLASAQVLSYRVLHFERAEDRSFRSPHAYPQLAVAAAGTHDLPTLRGWSLGQDLGHPSARDHNVIDLHGPLSERKQDLALLTQALHEEGLLPSPRTLPTDTFSLLNEAVHRFLARTPCVLAMAQLDDLTAEIEPINVPGTCGEYPNWRRKLSLTLEQLLDEPEWALEDPMPEANDRISHKL